ncbi:hypothetical protein OG689_41235 [Kitasatospora sp. NBC_00240]|uniref:hypothetical protein n=1 Tax=Kitasatospora sp. NBC_00240 TaxID=2903567 RepID=UPI002253FF79|nr:hypothetical protein [Kitasatospora sp. NBC_00240]MCX5215580.1 hypothetical protein [Kitasatospora sp. NBC_00240]
MSSVGSRRESAGVGAASVGLLMCIAAIWAGGGIGWPGMVLLFAGMILVGTSPEGRKQQAQQAEVKRSIPVLGRSLLGLRVTDGRVFAVDQEPLELAGTVATVESAGSVVHRATATRVVAGAALGGPLGAALAAVAAKKQVDDRTIFVVLTDPSGAQVLAQANKRDEAAVRQWVARFNTWTRTTA